MGFSISPSVQIVERDLSLSIPAISTTIAGMVGEFEWGQCNVIVPVTTDRQLINDFGEVNNTNYKSWFSAFNYLQYANSLLVVRAIDETTAKNGGVMVQDTGNPVVPVPDAEKILNNTDADLFTATFGGANDIFQILARYPGSIASDIEIAIANETDFPTANVESGVSFVDQFEFGPETDEIAICISYQGEIVERWTVSMVPGTKDDDGNNIYIEDFIKYNSAFVWAYHNTINTNPVQSNENAVLAGGVNDTPSSNEINNGYYLYRNPEEVDVNMLIDAAWTNQGTQQYIIDNILTFRLDVVGYFCVPESTCVNIPSISTAVSNMVDYRNDDLSRSTSYAALYGNWKYQEDTKNGVFRWLPVSADMAGVTAFTAQSRDPWIAPAGYNRGLVKNTIKFAVNPDLGFRDILYKNGINPLLVDSAEGPVVLGQKTLLTRPSSFDRLDVRWLFIVLEKAIATASKFFMFEKNTPFTRRQFKNMVDPFLRDVQGKQGIENFETQVDQNINTPEVVSRNEFRARIFIQPTITAEFIILEFVNVKSGVEFEETISKAA